MDVLKMIRRFTRPHPRETPTDGPSNPRNGHPWECGCAPCAIFWDTHVGETAYREYRQTRNAVEALPETPHRMTRHEFGPETFIGSCWHCGGNRDDPDPEVCEHPYGMRCDCPRLHITQPVTPQGPAR